MVEPQLTVTRGAGAWCPLGIALLRNPSPVHPCSCSLQTAARGPRPPPHPPPPPPHPPTYTHPPTMPTPPPPHCLPASPRLQPRIPVPQAAPLTCSSRRRCICMRRPMLRHSTHWTRSGISTCATRPATQSDRSGNHTLQNRQGTSRLISGLAALAGCTARGRKHGQRCHQPQTGSQQPRRLVHAVIAGSSACRDLGS